MINLNRYYNDLLLGFKESCSSVSKRAIPTKKDKMRKISSILDMKLFPKGDIDGSFIGRANAAIENTKKQILIILFQQAQFPSTARNVLDALRELNGDINMILETGILKCYQSILIVQQQDEHMRQNRLFRTLKNILQQIVRFSIIYNQYKKRGHTVQSESEIGSNQQFEINQKIIRSIEIEVFKRQIYDLVIQYLDSERIKLKLIKQICRICECKVSIQEMTSHLQYCQRKYYQLQQLQSNSGNLLKLQREIKQIQACSSNLEDKDLYNFVSHKIDRICGSDQPETSEIISIIGDLSELKHESDNDLIITYKKLTDERIKILEIISIINKESYVKEEEECVLEVDSIIREGKHKQTSLLKQKSTLSVQSHNENNSSIISESRRAHTTNTLAKNNSQILQTEDYEHSPTGNKKVVRWNIKKAVSMNRTFKDFEILKFLGKGAFGKVYLVRRVLTQDYYAVKCIKMDNNLLQDEKKIQNLKNEHDIFRKISGQFLVKAAFSFSEGSMHMFFLQYMPGGDFGALLEEQVYLQQDVAKFYLAEIVLAIEHLHNLNIIHRDLKPQNLVFDGNGHLKLTDFGLSKEGITKKLLITKSKASSEVFQQSNIKQIPKINSHSNKRKTLVKRNGKSNSNKSIVGTPDYIAPEVLNGISTENQSIDWWSFGVIVYETLIGEKPFGAQTIQKVFTNIRNMVIEYPPVGYDDGCISPEAFDLIQSLLNIDFSKRLGADSIDEIKQHKFFQGICWQTLKSMHPPLLVKKNNDSFSHENHNLRKQIEEEMNQIQSNLGQKIHLDDYMRIDLLLEKTLCEKQKVSNEIKQKKTKISYLYKKYVGVAKSMKDVPYI